MDACRGFRAPALLAQGLVVVQERRDLLLLVVNFEGGVVETPMEEWFLVSGRCAQLCTVSI
jgi:hypothetical protein